MKYTRTTDPIFENKKHGAGGGFPVLKAYWERFELSLLYMQLDKHSGVPPWILAFVYVCGLLSNVLSVNGIHKVFADSPVLKAITGFTTITQCALSRFAARAADWLNMSFKRMKIFLTHPMTRLEAHDVIAIDDTKIAHPFGKLMPFVCWLFDSSQKIDVFCMNLVTSLVVKANGLEFPLSWRFWRKTGDTDQKKSKIELVKQMLSQVRQIVETIPLWVAMDRWFLCKDLFLWLQNHNFDWVTKAKSNTALYQLSGYDHNGRPRYSPVNAKLLLIKVAHRFVGKKDERVAVSIPNIYMSMPYKTINKRGIEVTKHHMIPIAAIAVTRLPEDVEERTSLVEQSETVTVFHGTHLIISNRHDAPEAAVQAYTKRWRIEVFYRCAKQELGLTSCHAMNENAHFMHVEMLFVAETLVQIAMRELHPCQSNEESDEEIFTHGQVVQKLFIASCRIELHTRLGNESIRVYFDTTYDMFSRFLINKWPKYIQLMPWRISHLFEATA